MRQTAATTSSRDLSDPGVPGRVPGTVGLADQSGADGACFCCCSCCRLPDALTGMAAWTQVEAKAVHAVAVLGMGSKTAMTRRRSKAASCRAGHADTNLVSSLLASMLGVTSTCDTVVRYGLKGSSNLPHAVHHKHARKHDADSKMQQSADHCICRPRQLWGPYVALFSYCRGHNLQISTLAIVRPSCKTVRGTMCRQFCRIPILTQCPAVSRHCISGSSHSCM